MDAEHGLTEAGGRERGDACCAYLYTQGISSFSVMMLPSFLSSTASSSPSAFFFKNFFMPGNGVHIN